MLYRCLLLAVEIIVSMVDGHNGAYSHVQGPVRRARALRVSPHRWLDASPRA
jgi:hypothetical protein